jgi:D-sedoheptulose 7-phosphate isomerase
MDTLPKTDAGVPGYIGDYIATLQNLLAGLDKEMLVKASETLSALYTKNGRLVFCGNGGSATTASHLACDFQKCLYLDGKKPFEVIALCDSPALLTAWGNDTEFANVFAGQARTWLRKGDVLIAISGSGNSPNVLSCVEVAREVGAITIGFCGYGGGKLAAMSDISLVIPQNNMQQVEDLHLVMGHILFSLLRDHITGRLS